MKRLFYILLCLTLVVSLTNISLAAEHPGEHPGTPAKAEQKEHPGTTHTEEHPTEKPGILGEEINLEAFQYGYSPDPIVVKKGDTVKIIATSRDVTHGFYVKEYGINAVIKKGEKTELKFVADKAGEFDIRCSVYCGPGHMSMKAKLIVKE